MLKIIVIIFTLLLTSNVLAMPKITIKNQHNINKLAQIQVSNNTMENLICHVAIDGHKLLFHLKALESSSWFTATDVRFNHTHFSVWCDYLKLHPKHQ